MRYLVIIFLALLFACNSSNQNSRKINENPDSLFVTDNCFQNFADYFMYHKEFQISRTKIRNWQYINYHDGYEYTLNFFNSFNIPDEQYSKDLTNQKFLTIIDLKTSKKTELFFRKIDNKWFLFNTFNSIFKTDSVVDFETFLYRFSTDTIFTKKHIKFPLKYVFSDPDNDGADTTMFLNENNMHYYNFFDKGKLIFYHENKSIDSKKIMINLRGIDNGLLSFYYFEIIDGRWKLIEENDYSD
jgi:hypothetical protein